MPSKTTHGGRAHPEAITVFGCCHPLMVVKKVDQYRYGNERLLISYQTWILSVIKAGLWLIAFSLPAWGGGGGMACVTWFCLNSSSSNSGHPAYLNLSDYPSQAPPIGIVFRITIIGPSSTNWASYHSLSRLDRCKETIVFNLNVFDSLISQTTIKACTVIDNVDSGGQVQP